MQFTKQEISNLFHGIPTWESYEDMAARLSNTDLEVSVEMLQAMFRSQGFNLRNRPRKPNLTTNWFTVVDDTTPVDNTVQNTQLV